MTDIVQVKRLRTLAELRERLATLGITEQLGIDDDVDPHGALAAPLTFTDGATGEHTVGNRFTVLPMEGGTAPTMDAPPISCAGAGGASARAAPSSCGAARQWPSVTTAAPTRTSS